MPAVHTQALAGRGETYGWISAAVGASGDRVLASCLYFSSSERHGTHFGRYSFSNPLRVEG